MEQNDLYPFIERTKQEKLTEEEVKVYDDFLSEAGVKLERGSEVNAETIVSFFHESGATNEFIANTIHRLAQILPIDVTAKILLSDNDGDGVPLYRELELGTKVVEAETFAVINEVKLSSGKLKSQEHSLEI